MAGLGYACALLLAAVFVRAGAAKLARPGRTASGFAALGVPAALAPVVPVAELVVAVALLALPRAGAPLAVAVVAAFSLVLARALRRGVRAPCNCFGTARTDPVSPADLLRNGLLVVAAVVAATAPGPEWPAPAATLAAVAAFAAGALLVRAARR